MADNPSRDLAQSGEPFGLGELNLVRHIADSSNIVMNVRTDYVVTTRDKIEIVLRKQLPLFLRRHAWVAPLSLLIGLIASIVTSDFQDFMGLSKDVWSTTFVIGAILAFVWLVRNVMLLRGTVDLDGVLEAVVATHDVNDRRPLQGAVVEESRKTT